MMTVILGWLGSVLYLMNHGYISVVKNWRPKVYYGVNLLAALSLVASSLMIYSYQAVVINSFWAIISILLLIKFDVAKVPLSRRFFYLGFVLIIAWLIFSGLKYSWNSSTFHGYLGWSSSYVFCLSYLLFCSKKLSHINYLVFNIYAGSALLPILWAQQNWPVFTLQICWALISAYGVYTRSEQAHLID
ncbi:CBU_0592 family membrane protein [Colwellia piezophila]|uniref:CBU_0592 family membrane protein n=1 Tax=Colwellia piezophila TaxID=211668 RepID=UPI00035F7EB2|nr:hypothetical protein [Colwellia piezophila]